MTCTPVAIRNAASASSYLLCTDHLDYYSRDETCQSYWAGSGSSMLGIKGQTVDPSHFIRLLNGEIAGQTLGRYRGGHREHKAGIDLTTSPPKTVSLACLVGGDERIRVANREAVDEMINAITAKVACTRIHRRHGDGTESFEKVLTGNLTCAVFEHETSRFLDPFLHNHVAIINGTRTEYGHWRSIETKPFFLIQKEAGIIYRQALASKLRALGYGISRGREGNFEIEGFNSEQISEFSRRSTEIEGALQELGLDRGNSSAALKEKISHQTRSRKISADREELLSEWRKRASETGCDLEHIVNKARERASFAHWRQDDKVLQLETVQVIVTQTIASLSERESVFSRKHLKNELDKKAVGYGLSSEMVDRGLSWAEQNNLLVSGYQIKEYSRHLQCWELVDGFSTPKQLELERQMVNTVNRMRNNVKAEFGLMEIEEILNLAENASREEGFNGWTRDQKAVVRGLLSSTDQVSGVQGSAGTAKTSASIYVSAREFRKCGYIVRGLAPSVSACQTLSDGAKITDVSTVASHLLKKDKEFISVRKELWFVDEASLLSSRDMATLIQKAYRCKARLVLVGDTQQLGSVEAGAAFRQLQAIGLTTFKLEEIVRQKNPNLLAAVQHSISGQTKEVLYSLDKGGGKITEIPGKATERYQAIANHILSLSPAERMETLVIEPSCEGRDYLTSIIRSGLKSRGELNSSEFNVDSYRKVDMTRESAKDILSYQVGECITFRRSYKSKRVEKGSYWTVDSIHESTNVATLISDSGVSIKWNPRSWGASNAQCYRRLHTDLVVGDRVVWNKNDKFRGLFNGMKAEVTSVDRVLRKAVFRFANGRTAALQMDELANMHWSHDYVSTAYAAQGRTCERAVYHVESYRTNLTSRKALYVSLSRAKHEVLVVTDNREKLIRQLTEHSGEKSYASERGRNEHGHSI